MVKRLAIVVAIVLAAGVCLTPVQTIWDDGLWPLSVTVTSASSAPIASVSGQAFSSEESARYSLEHLAPPDTRVHSAVADPYTGEPLAVPVPTSLRTHSALTWSSSRYNQMRQLLVIVQYQDGRRAGRLVEIPDLRESRSVLVEFP